MKLWFMGTAYNKEKGYEFIWDIYENTTVGTVYTQLEARQDVFVNGNEKLMPMLIKQVGNYVLVTQQFRGEQDE